MRWEVLGGAPAEAVEAVLDRARERRFRRHEVLFHADDPGDELHFISRGRIGVRIDRGVDDRLLVDILGPGQIVGEMALLSPGAPRMATAVALEDTETHAIREEQFTALRREFPGVDDLLVGLLAARLRTITGRLVEALHDPAERRVLRRLLDLADTVDAGTPDRSVAVTQDELAALAGTTRNTVNRVLRRERATGALHVSRRSITLLDEPGLRRRA